MTSMNNYQELEKHCKSFTKGFESIKQYALDFATSRKPIKKGMDAIWRSGPDKIAMEYEIQNGFLFMIAEVFQSPKMLKQIQTKHDAALTSEGRKVLTFWQEAPAFWCYFTVKGHLSGDFWTIEDRMTGEEHILHSKGISTMQKWKDSEGLSFLCIMQPNGKCLQTVGMLKQYRLPVSDFLFYCTLFKPEESLQEILHKHFIQFFTLDKVGSVPPTKRDSYEMGFSWQPFTLPQFATEDLGGLWFSTTLAAKQKFSIHCVDTSMLDLPNIKVFETAPKAMTCAIFRDTATGEMGLFTNTEVAYTFYSTLLNRTYPELKLPEKPLYFISLALQLILTAIDVPTPWKQFAEILAYEEPPERVEEERKKGWEEMRDKYGISIEDAKEAGSERALAELFLESLETGKPMDLAKVCKATGLDRKTVEDIWNKFDGFDERDELGDWGLFGDDEDDEWDDEDEWGDDDEEEDEEVYEDVFYIVPDEDKVFELVDLPMPEDMLDDVLSNTLSNSEIFVITLATMGDAHKQFLQLVSKDYAVELNRFGMLKSIELLFLGTFEEKLAYPIMNACIWILLSKGKEYVPVRSYAIEILKWIPSEIMHFYLEEEFIELFSKFVKQQLCTKGVCTLAKRPTAAEIKKGTYAIKGTGALFTLLKIREEDD